MQKEIKTKKDLGNSTAKFQKTSILLLLTGLLMSLLLVSGCSGGEIQNMVYVKGGTFQMGSSESKYSQPIHSVTVASFYIGKHHITQKEWQAVMEGNKNEISTEPNAYGDNPQAPIIRVSWYDAIVFCNRKSIQEGLKPCYEKSGEGNPDNWGVPKSGNNDVNWDAIKCNWSANGYRLPTEAEWEYAAKGGNKTKGFRFAGSNNINDVGWYEGNSGDELHDSGAKAANELGVYDMTGNAWEWCWDWYDTYASNAETNPYGANDGTDRVGRGGSSGDDEEECHVAYRLYGNPGRSYSDLGFRVARTTK
ncbi:MAG TPA: formylglycine-generating enzyme family protein [Candidatus Cloacimonadota bacterium]|nr:formylglycine-generating enzyme family protein [Candidatus Cloacimonadota bacterium]